uniref:PDZ domain-containing protein n=1 Tax=Hanusia phi TaxID=3032 RepID=A0A7S0E215_9CRYP|mmetsp:Transcript_14991/g.34499  ORF Transcript_14991/g.34499 Transcript_14991/m.34499 type:complete len:511 (+) Transcript_14991:1-1533(+)
MQSGPMGTVGVVSSGQTFIPSKCVGKEIPPSEGMRVTMASHLRQHGIGTITAVNDSTVQVCWDGGLVEDIIFGSNNLYVSEINEGSSFRIRENLIGQYELIDERTIYAIAEGLQDDLEKAERKIEQMRSMMEISLQEAEGKVQKTEKSMLQMEQNILQLQNSVREMEQQIAEKDRLILALQSEVSSVKKLKEIVEIRAESEAKARRKAEQDSIDTAERLRDVVTNATEWQNKYHALNSEFSEYKLQYSNFEVVQRDLEARIELLTQSNGTLTKHVTEWQKKYVNSDDILLENQKLVQGLKQAERIVEEWKNKHKFCEKELAEARSKLSQADMASSNSKLWNEKIESWQKSILERDSRISQLEQSNIRLEAECSRLTQENRFLTSQKGVDRSADDSPLRSTTQNVGTVGLVLDKDGEDIYVLDIISGSAAEADGRIKVGDGVLEINGRTTKDLSVTLASLLLRGDVGSECNLRMQARDGPSYSKIITRTKIEQSINADISVSHPPPHVSMI